MLEAIEAYSHDNIRVVEDMAVLNSFDDSMEALRRHDELHKQKPDRRKSRYSRKKMDWIKKNMIKINEVRGLPYVEATVA